MANESKIRTVIMGIVYVCLSLISLVIFTIITDVAFRITILIVTIAVPILVVGLVIYGLFHLIKHLINRD